MSIGVVVVGPGLIGKKHISLVRAHSGAHLAAIIAPDSEQNIRIAKENNVPLFPHLDACIQVVRPNAVIISSPNVFHYDQALWCIMRQIPVLIEKPITVCIEEAKQIVEATERHRALALVGHHRAYSPLLEKASEIIQGGALGKIITFMGSAQFYKPDAYFREAQWRTQPGGGPILINLIHEIGNMRTLIGEIEEVQAFSSNAARGFVVEDSVVMNFRFRGGALGSFMLSDATASPMSWEQTARENPIYASYEKIDCYTIAGTKGSLGFPTLRAHLSSGNTPPSWLESLEERSFEILSMDPLSRQLDHFIELIRGNVSPRVSVIDGYRNLMVVESIRRAIKTGKVEKVDF